MSRCENPQDCTCAQDTNLDDLLLRCGPCDKCQKRAQEMQSNVVMNYVRKLNHTKPESGIIYCNLARIVSLFWLIISLLLTFVKLSVESSPLRTVKTRASAREDELNLQQPWVPWGGLYTASALQKMQERDPDIGPIHSWMQTHSHPDSKTIASQSPATRHYWTHWDSLQLKNGILFKQFYKRDGSGEYLQFIVPRQMRKEVFQQMHTAILSGHLGSKKTRLKMLRRFYWFELKEDVTNWTLQCQTCAEIKSPARMPKAPLGKMTVGAPMDRLATDIVGPLPRTPRGNRFILVVTDYFTKWVEVFPIADQTAETCADIILNEVIARYGCPLDLHSDQGRNYESDIFKELCRMLEIRKNTNDCEKPVV